MMQTESTSLVHIRALGQVNYCPKLYYLEQVLGSRPGVESNSELDMGQSTGENDGVASLVRFAGNTLPTCTLVLSSERLRITGRIEYLQEDASVVRPVLFRQSPDPTDEPEYTHYRFDETILLCAHGLLLEYELGLDASEGVLADRCSHKTVVVPFSGALRARTLDAILLARALDRSPHPPDPLPPGLQHRCTDCIYRTSCFPGHAKKKMRAGSF